MSDKAKILITCPPMLNQIEHFAQEFEMRDWEITAPNVTQTLPESELIKLVPAFDGWIIGDDPATSDVVRAAKNGKLKAAVKWGVGVDNLDVDAFELANIPICNTPGMFGKEVADIALGYLIGLCRQTYSIDHSVKNGDWPKPSGISLAGKTCALVGYGDIGQNFAKRLGACEVEVRIYDPAHSEADNAFSWPNGLDDCDFICFTCALNEHNHHMLTEETMRNHCKTGVRIVNVARGPLIDERALERALKRGKVHSVALDVFEQEPLPKDSYLRTHPLSIFGSHNSSNTVEAVYATSIKAINLLESALN